MRGEQCAKIYIRAVPHHNTFHCLVPFDLIFSKLHLMSSISASGGMCLSDTTIAEVFFVFLWNRLSGKTKVVKSLLLGWQKGPLIHLISFSYSIILVALLGLFMAKKFLSNLQAWDCKSLQEGLSEKLTGHTPLHSNWLIRSYFGKKSSSFILVLYWADSILGKSNSSTRLSWIGPHRCQEDTIDMLCYPPCINQSHRSLIHQVHSSYLFLSMQYRFKVKLLENFHLGMKVQFVL
jgi:hypothetical protein